MNFCKNISVILFFLWSGASLAEDFGVKFILHYREVMNLNDDDSAYKINVLNKARSICGSIEFILRRGCDVDRESIKSSIFIVGGKKQELITVSISAQNNNIRISGYKYEDDGLLDGLVRLTYKSEVLESDAEGKYRNSFGSICEKLALSVQRKCEIGDISVVRTDEGEKKIFIYSALGLISTKDGIFVHEMSTKSSR